MMKDNEQQQQRRTGSSNKGLLEGCILGAALATGTAASILTKVMYAATDEQGRHFDKPIAQTFYMFLAMIVGLPSHWLVVAYKIPFPGYHHAQHQADVDVHGASTPATEVVIDIDATPRINTHKHTSGGGEHQNLLPTSYVYGNNNNAENDDDNIEDHTTTVPWKTYLQLSIPAFFDCTSTALFMIGLLFLNVSVYQLLRGSGIIFVGMLRQYGLKQTLYQYQWVGLWYNVASAVLVGAAALLDSTSSITTSSIDDATTMTMVTIQTNNLEACGIGVTFMMLGTLLQSMEFVLEEKFMVADEVKVPPLLFFGMKGFWGVVMTLSVLYPIAYYIPGHDQGSFENFWTGWEMVLSTRYIRILVILSMVIVFGFNLFCVLVTFLLSSIWHAILDNFRPLTVWCTDLLLYYVIERQQAAAREDRLGESWTPYSWLQLAGMAVLLYGTAIYNAPDSGSIRLEGKWYSLGLDFSQEYNKIAEEREVSQIRRSFGSYPSLQGFLNVSARNLAWYGDDDNSITFGKRARTWQPRASPKLYAIHGNNARNYASMSQVNEDLSQRSI